MIAGLFLAMLLAEPSAGSTSGKIIFYRPQALMGYAIACQINYQGAEVVELGRGKFAEWTVAPGRYILTNKSSSIEVTVDPGEIRYVRCLIKPGMLKARAELQIVDRASYDEHASAFEKKDIVPPGGKTPAVQSDGAISVPASNTPKPDVAAPVAAAAPR